MAMPDPPANRILDTQSRYNRSTAESWQTYASHRAEIGNLLAPVGTTDAGRLCVLGAGNCNDLDLRSLVEVFREIHLVDLDAAALEGAVRRQEVESSPKIRLHGGTDLTGIAGRLGGAKGRPDDEAVAECVRLARDFPGPDLGGPFDLVLSPCVLSQISGYAGDVLGRRHPRYAELMLAIRDRHLRLLVELTAPGGAGLLVCDMLSSDSAGELSAARRDDLPDLMNRLVSGGKFFPGLAPAAVESFFRTDPLTAPLLGDVRRLRPWAWQLTPKRTFLVYAVRFRRSRGAVILGPG